MTSAMSFRSRPRANIKGASLQDRWRYTAPGEKYPNRSAAHEIWYFHNSDYQYKVVRRSAFFDAERDTFILGRFAALEDAQRCVETDAARVRIKRPRKSKQMPG